MAHLCCRQNNGRGTGRGGQKRYTVEEGKRAVREETYAIDGPTQQRSTVNGHVVLIFRVSNATFSFPLLQHRPME